MWQLFLIGYFIFGTTAYITRRMLMLHHKSSARLFNLIFWLIFFMPSGWVFGSLLPHSLTPGWGNIALLFLGALFWPVVGVVGFRANKEVDTGFYAIMINIAPIITLLLALSLLHEKVTMQSIFGIFLLILSGIIVAIPLLRHGSHSSRYGFFLCLIVVFINGVGVAYERWMLSLVGLGTYMLFAWTFETIWMVILAHKQLLQVSKFFKTADVKAKQFIVFFGIANVLRTVCFQSALFLSGSASIISAATNFLAVTVLVAAYVLLHEKQYLRYKVAAVIVGIMGLFLVTK